MSRPSGIVRTGNDPNMAPTNVFKNAIAPLDARVPGRLQGTAVYVAAEVAVSKLLRKIMSADSKGFMELTAVHTVSLALMGGINAPLKNQQSHYQDRLSDQIKMGAYGIPAVFLAQYVYNTFMKGFHLSFWSMKDALIMAAAKILTRPVLAKIVPNARFLQDGLGNQAGLEGRQVAASNLRT